MPALNIIRVALGQPVAGRNALSWPAPSISNRWSSDQYGSTTDRPANATP